MAPSNKKRIAVWFFLIVATVLLLLRWGQASWVSGSSGSTSRDGVSLPDATPGASSRGAGGNSSLAQSPHVTGPTTHPGGEQTSGSSVASAGFATNVVSPGGRGSSIDRQFLASNDNLPGHSNKDNATGQGNADGDVFGAFSGSSLGNSSSGSSGAWSRTGSRHHHSRRAGWLGAPCSGASGNKSCNCPAGMPHCGRNCHKDACRCDSCRRAAGGGTYGGLGQPTAQARNFGSLAHHTGPTSEFPSGGQRLAAGGSPGGPQFDTPDSLVGGSGDDTPFGAPPGYTFTGSSGGAGTVVSLPGAGDPPPGVFSGADLPPADNLPGGVGGAADPSMPIDPNGALDPSSSLVGSGAGPGSDPFLFGSTGPGLGVGAASTFPFALVAVPALVGTVALVPALNRGSQGPQTLPNTQPVPEPAFYQLALALGTGGLYGMRRRRRSG